LFATLLALVAAQCSPEGNTYWFTENGNTHAVTFGTAVGEWLPALLNHADGVDFTVWSQATVTRWEVQGFGSSTGFFCDQKGQYSLEFFNECTELHLTTISDSCRDRVSFLNSQVFTIVEEGDSCDSEGNHLWTAFPESEEYLRFSDDAASFVFGLDQYALLSLGETAAIVQRWRLTEGEDEDTVEVVDLASFPKGFACPPASVGTYFTHWEEDCKNRICLDSDDCGLRATLFHNAALNDFEGDMCSNEVDTEGEEAATCSDGRQWLKHPKDCTAQPVEGGCIFCKGIAGGEITTWCLDKEGAVCQDVFESAAARAFCNMEFECPASTVTFSIALLICTLLALVFH